MGVIWRAATQTTAGGLLPVAMSLVTAPTSEPIAMEEAKLHLRETQNDEDTLIERLIVSERRSCEAMTDLKLITQTWDLVYDAFPSSYPLYLSIAPIQSVTSVSYVDEAGATQVWTSTLYRFVAPTLPPFVRRMGYILPVYDGLFPTAVRDISRAVTVRVVAGFGASGVSVPADLITDMLANIGSRFTEGRQSVVAGGFISRVPDVGLYSGYRPAV